MKKFIYFLLIAFVAIACDKWETPVVIPHAFSAYTPDFDSRTPGTRSTTLWEYQPESWDGPENIETRTYAVIAPDNEYIQYWSEADAISVFFTSANLKYQFTGFVDEDQDGTDEEDYGHFELVGNQSTGTEFSREYYYSVYPYKETTTINYDNGTVTYNLPKIQHYNGDSYSNGENGMIAREPKDGDGILYFKNFCSYLQLRLIDSTKVSQNNQGKIVKQITLAANNTNDKLTGDAAIRYDGEDPIIEMKMTSTHQITLDCGGGVELSKDLDNPSKFWFVLPGDFTFSEGFSITVTFSDGSYFEKSTTKSISIERSHIKPMAPFSPSDSNEDMVLTGPIRYKYEDTSITEPYPLNNTFFGENGEPLQIIDQIYDEETEEWVVLLSGTLKTIGGNSFVESEPDLEYIKVDNGDTSITLSEFTFYNCTAESIMIYNNVDSIKESAFENATTTSLYIDGDITTLKANVGSGSYIEEIVVNGNVGLIDEYAFSSCMFLQTVECDSIEHIGYRAFYQCRSLSDIDLSTVKYIEEGAFRGCTSLPSVSLNSIITIGDNAFMGCSKMTSVEISSVCTMIGEGAFCNTTRLKTFICNAVLPPFIKTDNTDGCYVFDKAHKDLVIYIPDGSMSYYSDPQYFVNNDSGYSSPVQATVNWWYQEYEGKLKVE